MIKRLHKTNYFLCFILFLLFLFVSCKKKPPTEPQIPVPTTPILSFPTELIDEPRRGIHISFSHEGGADGFLIQRKQGDGNFTNYVTLGPSTSMDYEAYYDDWKVEMSQFYAYRVRAFNSNVNSDWSFEGGINAPGSQTRELPPAIATEDAYIDETFPNEKHGSRNTLLVTKERRPDGGERRAYIKFPIDAVPSHAIDIDYAVIRLFTQGELILRGAPTINVWQVTGNWDESSITWNNKPNRQFLALDFNQIVRNTGNPYFWDISGAVRRWFKGTDPNFGIVFESVSPFYQAVLISKESASAIRPTIQIRYVW